MLMSISVYMLNVLRLIEKKSDSVKEMKTDKSIETTFFLSFLNDDKTLCEKFLMRFLTNHDKFKEYLS